MSQRKAHARVRPTNLTPLESSPAFCKNISPPRAGEG